MIECPVLGRDRRVQGSEVPGPDGGHLGLETAGQGIHGCPDVTVGAPQGVREGEGRHLLLGRGERGDGLLVVRPRSGRAAGAAGRAVGGEGGGEGVADAPHVRSDRLLRLQRPGVAREGALHRMKLRPGGSERRPDGSESGLCPGVGDGEPDDGGKQQGGHQGGHELDHPHAAAATAPAGSGGQLRRGRHHTPALLEAVLVNGIRSLAFVLLESCAVDELKEREQTWFDVFPDTFNVSRYTASALGDDRSAPTL